MIFSGYVYILMVTIVYKYGWNLGLDNNFMNLYLTVCQRERRTSKFLQFNYSSLKGSVHSIKFCFCFLKKSLPHQLVTMQGKVFKI